MRPKTKLFAVEFRRILEVLVLQGLWKKFWAHYHDLFVQKWNCLPWIQTHFGSFLPPRFTEKVLDKYSRFMCPETTLFAVKFTHIWKLSVCNFYRKFWAQFHNLCVQKRSCLTWSWDAFLKFSLCDVRDSGRNFTIYAFKNEAVCREVETQFRKFSACEVYRKSSGRMFTI